MMKKLSICALLLAASVSVGQAKGISTGFLFASSLGDTGIELFNCDYPTGYLWAGVPANAKSDYEAKAAQPEVARLESLSAKIAARITHWRKTISEQAGSKDIQGISVSRGQIDDLLMGFKRIQLAAAQKKLDDGQVNLYARDPLHPKATAMIAFYEPQIRELKTKADADFVTLMVDKIREETGSMVKLTLVETVIP